MNNQKLYVEYRGGAGPDEQQSENNDKVMGMALKENKIPFIWTDENAQELWDGDEQQMKIERPSDGEVIYVSYDRWGFCTDGPLDVDQGDLKTTLQKIKDWYNGKDNE